MYRFIVVFSIQSNRCDGGIIYSAHLPLTCRFNFSPKSVALVHFPAHLTHFSRLSVRNRVFFLTLTSLMMFIRFRCESKCCQDRCYTEKRYFEISNTLTSNKLAAIRDMNNLKKKETETNGKSVCWRR